MRFSKTHTDFVLGIDEVGRGSLAGPVCLAGVLTPIDLALKTFVANPIDKFFRDNPEFKFVRDSKKLSEIKRQKVVDLIDQNDFPAVILYASNELIDKFGIGVCLSNMLILIVDLLGQKYDLVDIIVDGKIKLLPEIDPVLENLILAQNNLLKPKNTWSENFSKIQRLNFADDNFLSVALASNIAKVSRDSLMNELHSQYPNFGWAKNKGYGTVQNRSEIAKNKQNKYLRRSFLSKI
jgi:ribonuclease HII